MPCKTKGNRIKSKAAGKVGRGLGYGDGDGPMDRRNQRYNIELILDEGL